MDTALPAASTLQSIPLNKIYTSPHQMRRTFEEEPLKELARSLKEEGLIQPVVVRPVGNSFELIAGERRLRAAEMIGWKSIEARIIHVNDEGAAVKGLIENLQRSDLNAIEEARGYKQLVEAPYNLTQDEVSRRVGKCQSAIARALALLELPEEVQALMPRGIVTESHARLIRKLPEKKKQIQLAKKIDKEDLSVKETERLVEALSRGGVEASSSLRLHPSTPLLSQEEDPLSKIWPDLKIDSTNGSSQAWKVRYQGNGQWKMEVSADPKNPNKTLGDFLMKLGRAIKDAD